MSMRFIACTAVGILTVCTTTSAFASGHGPVFGAATPTLGRGGWSVDQAWTLRSGDADERQQMLKTMLSFGVTENLQLSGSFPLAMQDGRLAAARMMGAMSSDREFEALSAYRFQRRTVGIGGRQESTVYVGGTAPFDRSRNGIGVGPSLEAGISTGYASRAHYVWLGGTVQRFAERDGDRVGASRLLTAVFVTVGALLAVNYWLAVVRPRRMNCAPGELCHVDSPAMRINRALFWLSLVIFAGAVTFTYAALWWVRMQS